MKTTRMDPSIKRFCFIIDADTYVNFGVKGDKVGTRWVWDNQVIGAESMTLAEGREYARKLLKEYPNGHWGRQPF